MCLKSYGLGQNQGASEMTLRWNLNMARPDKGEV